MRPGPKAITTTASPGRRGSGGQDALEDHHDGGRRGIAGGGQDAPGGDERLVVEAEALGYDVEDLRASGVHRPGGDVADVQLVAPEQVLDRAPHVAGEDGRELGGQPNLEAAIGDVPPHVVGAGGVGARGDVDHLWI